MDFTPEQLALNERVCELPIILGIKEKEQEIIRDLEGLKIGQDNIERRLDKGAERMDGIEDELKSLKDALNSGLKDVISEVRDQKLYELKNELKDRKSSDNNLKNDMIKIIIVAVLGSLGYLMAKVIG